MVETKQIESVGVVANVAKEGIPDLVSQVEDVFSKNGIATLVEQETAKHAGRREGTTFELLVERCDIILALGGDGTILEIVSRLGACGKPIAAINIGRLGFLTCARSDSLRTIAKALASGEYTLSQRCVLKVVIEGQEQNTHFALNEAALNRSEISTTITLEARIDGEFFSNYNGDGLILATPTGSTAYSFSAGGAIVDPASNVLLLTPICPHALANRSMVVPDTSEVEITPLRDDHQVALTVDGRFVQEIPIGVSVTVSKAGFQLPLVMLPDQTFFAILREKLQWQGSNV
ncbi:MAG: NAD(+)/NADH kinase [Verrucomicrobiota bacterium]